MSNEAVVIPQQLQQYINQCLDDAELKSLKVIPVKISGYAVNLRDYYDFERREFAQFKGNTITVADIKELTKHETAQYKRERANKFYKYYPALPSDAPTVTTAAAAAASTAPTNASDTLDYSLLVDYLRRQRRERMASAVSSTQSSATPEKTATVSNPSSTTVNVEASNKSQSTLPSYTKINLQRHATFAQTSTSEKQQSASSHSNRSVSATSSSSTNIDAVTSKASEKTPLLRK